MGVFVVYGADEDEFECLEGVTFSEAVRIAKDLMTIPDDITDIRLNNSENPLQATILKNGDKISFYKRAGSKA